MGTSGTEPVGTVTAPLRFGLLGTGPWAAATCAPALAGSDDADLVGVWGRDPARAAALAAEHGARGYPDLDALLADVDAVAVALPPDVQAPLAVRAAAAGRHLLLDKPLALDVAAADAVLAAVDAAGVASVLFFTNLFRPSVRAFLDDAAARGGWELARAVHLTSIFVPGNPYGGSAWRRRRGGLWDVGPHALSVLLPVLGPVARVAAVAGPRDETHLLAGHDAGAVSTLSLAIDAPPAARAHEVTFYGAGGVLSLPSHDAGDGTAPDGYRAAVAELAAAARAGRTAHPLDVRTGRHVVAVLAAAEEAASTGRTVPVP